MAEHASDTSLIAAQEALKTSLSTLPLRCTMIEPLRPQHFITRQNGTMVPLIALDELPATVSLRGVPRTLSPYDIAGMTGLGTVESHHRQYVVDGPKQGLQPEQNSPKDGLFLSKYADAAANHDLGSSFGGLERQSHAASSTAHGPYSKAYGIKEMRPTIPSSLNTASVRTTEAVGRPLTIEDLARNPAPGVKEYCSYWLRHGECDYAQQGCLYRHEMPLDPPTLAKLGLRDIPRWYREKHGLGSYLALDTQRSGSGNQRSTIMERNWRGHPEIMSSGGTAIPRTSPVPRKEHGKNAPSQTTVDGRIIPTDKQGGSHNCNGRATLNTPSVGRQACASPKLATNNRHPSTIRHGNRLVPAHTETISARILREANEQLDAHEKRERAALQKYAPLIPQNPGGAVAFNIITPPPSEHGSSSVDSLAAPVDTTADAMQSNDVTTTPAPLSPGAVHQRESAVAPAPAPGPAKRKAGVRVRTRTRPRKGVVDMDRETQHRVVVVAQRRHGVEEDLTNDRKLVDDQE